MLAAIIIISLLSLLVATEAEPTGETQNKSGEKPLRPKAKGSGVEPKNDPAQIAA